MWTHGEPGPDCFCGWPTVVWVIDGLASVMCFGHTKAEGALFPLPSRRPDKWPDVTHEEMAALVEEGMREHSEKEKEDEHHD